MIEQEPKNELNNPIDKDKVAENPGLLPYAHTVGSLVIKPEDKGKIKGRAVTAMRQQTHMHLSQIYKQIEQLAEQAKAIRLRVEVSEMIYAADIGFDPIINNIYYLYQRNDESFVLSLIAPEEWGRSLPYKRFVAAARLLADHTWEIIHPEATH
jgi:hypothetical protein